MKFLNNTPWWLISAGLHAVFLMGAALVYVERLMALDVTPIIITPREMPSPILDQPEKRDIFNHRGVVSEASETRSVNDDPVLFFPIAKVSDHNETADNADDHGFNGDSEK